MKTRDEVELIKFFEPQCPDPNPAQQILLALAATMAGHGKDIICGQKQQFRPVIQMVTSDGLPRSCDLTDMFDSPLHCVKDVLIAVLLKQTGADFYCFGTESWSLSRKAPKDAKLDELMEDYEHGDLSRHPERVSCFTITAESITGDVLMVNWEIDEEHDRQIDWANPITSEIGTYQEFEKQGREVAGNMMNLFGKLAASRLGDDIPRH